MRMSEALTLLFRNVAAFAKQACWLIALLTIPLLLEPLIEGLVKSADLHMSSVEALWSGWAILRFLTVLIVLFAQIRFHALGNDLRSALKFDRAALRTFLPFAIAYVTSRFAILFAVTETESAFGPLVASLWPKVDLVLAPLFALWAVSAPGGGTVISPLKSAKTMVPHLLWSMAFLILALLPLLGVWMLTSFTAYRIPELAGALFLLDRALEFVAGPLVMFGAMYVMARRAGLKANAAAE